MHVYEKTKFIAYKKDQRKGVNHIDKNILIELFEI